MRGRDELGGCGQRTRCPITTRMGMPSSDWSTGENLFVSLPGGQSVVDWFGFCPDFHDGALEPLELVGR
jgi:hypothetical protein